MNPEEKEKNQEEVSLTFLQVTLSVLASMFGVQSNKNRIRDFKHGKPMHFILGGIIFVIIFFIVVLSIVEIALST